MSDTLFLFSRSGLKFPGNFWWQLRAKLAELWKHAPICAAMSKWYLRAAQGRLRVDFYFWRSDFFSLSKHLFKRRKLYGSMWKLVINISTLFDNKWFKILQTLYVYARSPTDEQTRTNLVWINLWRGSKTNIHTILQNIFQSDSFWNLTSYRDKRPPHFCFCPDYVYSLRDTLKYLTVLTSAEKKHVGA